MKHYVLERLAARSVWQPTERSAEIGDCLVWKGCHDRRGYGQIQLSNPRRKGVVHRVAWIARHGEPPPETPCVLHHCDNRPCWRDEHLFLGTNADNSADMVAKGRARTNGNDLKTCCPQNHPYDEENTHWWNGRRYCRACNRAQKAKTR